MKLLNMQKRIRQISYQILNFKILAKKEGTDKTLAWGIKLVKFRLPL